MGFLQSLKGLEQELKDSVTDESSPFSSREGSAMYPPPYHPPYVSGLQKASKSIEKDFLFKVN